MTPYEQGRVSARSRALSAGVCPYELRSKEAAEWQSGYADQRVYMNRMENLRIENDARRARAERAGGSYGYGW